MQGTDNEIAEPLVVEHEQTDEHFATGRRKTIRGDTQEENLHWQDNLKTRRVFEGHFHDTESERRSSRLTAGKAKDEGVVIIRQG